MLNEKKWIMAKNTSKKMIIEVSKETHEALQALQSKIEQQGVKVTLAKIASHNLEKFKDTLTFKLELT